ncbi:hypothetical protein BDM02DRAFT_3221786 [Thelephora ganbajun]|uniref:Uncharacterized protein n=1 Tax=Thelephora ganbajun TaxID=370292 RepID=A0ACB6Z1L6_THEGA|nr:hypothetical protein BDM02DRAFT_3221786 [Thelephora ganbajun]
MSAALNNATTSTSLTAALQPVKPSPLSQGNYVVAEKCILQDGSRLGKMHNSMPGGSRGGLKSRALSFNALQEEAEAPSKGKVPQTCTEAPTKSKAIRSLHDSPDTTSSTLPKKSRRMVYKVQKEDHEKRLTYYRTDVYQHPLYFIKPTTGDQIFGKTFMWVDGPNDKDLSPGSFDFEVWKKAQSAFE